MIKYIIFEDEGMDCQVGDGVLFDSKEEAIQYMREIDDDDADTMSGRIIAKVSEFEKVDAEHGKIIITMNKFDNKPKKGKKK